MSQLVSVAPEEATKAEGFSPGFLDSMDTPLQIKMDQEGHGPFEESAKSAGFSCSKERPI